MNPFLSISTNTVYTHPTSSGNKHIPSGGSAGQILRWSSDGTAVWGSDNNTTYSTGTSSASGLTKLYGGTGSATDGTMTQSAITSALNGKVSNGSQPTFSGINLDAKGAYIYNQGNGNIYFRYRNTASSDYSYITIAELVNNYLKTTTGGNVNGSIDVCTSSGVSDIHVGTFNSNFGVQASITLGASGKFGLFDNTHGKWLLYNELTSNENAICIPFNYSNTDVLLYTPNESAIKFTGGTPWGIAKLPNSLQVVNDSGAKFRFQDRYCYCDVGFYSQGIFNSSSSSTANLHIDSNGLLRRIGSASKYKLDIKPLEEDASYPYKLLKLEPKQWFDKGDIERYSDLLTKEYNKEEIDEEEKVVAENSNIDSYYGLIAEDLESAGLNKFCTYGKEDKNGKKEVEGVMYDRIPILMIPILKDIVTLLKEVMPSVKEKITDTEVLKKITEILDRMK